MASKVQNPDVVHTELEDGAVLLNMESGFYYSLDTVGTEIWRLVERTRDMEEIGRLLARRFDVTEERATAAASRLLEELTRENLVIARDDATTRLDDGPDDSEPVEMRRPFTEPELVKHDEPLNQMNMHPFDPQLPLAE